MKNRMYKKCLFLLIGSMILMGQSGNINADIPVVGSILIPKGIKLKSFKVNGGILQKDFFAPNNNNDDTAFLNKLTNTNGFIYATIADQGTLLRIFADSACTQTQLLASFKIMASGQLLNTIEWMTNSNSKGSIDISKQALLNYNTHSDQSGPAFAISVTWQKELKVLSSFSKSYQVYDLYMAESPSIMTVDRSNVDISTYSYATPSDGPLFMFQSTICYDVSGNKGCTNCNITTKFAIDGVSVALPSLPTNDAWNLFVIVRVHVGQSPNKAPGLPSTIPNTSPTMNLANSTITLNGITLSMVELSSDNKTWYSIPINVDFNHNGSYVCILLDTNYINLGGDNGEIQTQFGYGSGPVFVRINKMFIYSNPIVTIKDRIGNPAYFYIKQ